MGCVVGSLAVITLSRRFIGRCATAWNNILLVQVLHHNFYDVGLLAEHTDGAGQGNVLLG